MEVLDNLIRREKHQEINEWFVEFVKTHTYNEIIDVIKNTEILIFLHFFDKCNSHTRETVTIYEPKFLCTHMMFHRNKDIIKTWGDWEGQEWGEPEMRVEIVSMNQDLEFDEVINQIKSL